MKRDAVLASMGAREHVGRHLLLEPGHLLRQGCTQADLVPALDEDHGFRDEHRAGQEALPSQAMSR